MTLALPIRSVFADPALRRPQAPAGNSLVVKVTASFDTPTPLGLVTLAVAVVVEVPSAGMTPLTTVNVTATEFGATVWLIVVDARSAPRASVAVMVQVPTVAEAEYVEITWPLVLVVVEVGLNVPQAADGLPLVVRLTGSPETAAPPEVVTETVITEVFATAAWRLEGSATTLIEAAAVPAACCKIVAEPVPPLASVAVIVQNPAVALLL